MRKRPVFLKQLMMSCYASLYRHHEPLSERRGDPVYQISRSDDRRVYGIRQVIAGIIYPACFR